MWSSLLLFSIFNFSPIAFSQVLLQAAETTSAEYQAALLSNPSNQSYVEFQKSKLLREAPVNELRRIYSGAMAAYLNGDTSAAQKNFEKVAELRHQYHWNESARYLIFTACLRRAQLENSQYARQSWLNVSLEIGWDQEPDPKLFSPPLIQEWQTQKDQLSWISIHNLIVDPYLNSLMISGHFYDLKKNLPKIPKIRARISYLSNQKHTVSAVIMTDQLTKEINWKDWLAATKCEETKNWEASKSDDKFKTIWPSHCLGKMDLEITKAPPAFHSASVQLNKPSVSSNKWIWWGLSTLAVAYVIYDQNKKQQESSPTQSSSYGF